MRRRFVEFWQLRSARLGYRLRYGPQKRMVRCPACKAMQSVPIGRGQTKLVCRRCGEIFLRRT